MLVRRSTFLLALCFASAAGCAKADVSFFPTKLESSLWEYRARDLIKAGEASMDALDASVVYRATVGMWGTHLVRVQDEGEGPTTHSKVQRWRHIGPRTTVSRWDREFRRRATTPEEFARLEDAFETSGFWSMPSEHPNDLDDEISLRDDGYLCTVEAQVDGRYHIVHRFNFDADAEFEKLCATFVELSDHDASWARRQ